MLFNLPLAGSTFKKVYYDSILARCVSKFIPAEDLVVSYQATSLEDADLIVHVVKMSGNDLLKQMQSGFYMDQDVGTPMDYIGDIQEKKDDLEGMSRTAASETHTLLECHVELDLPGFEDQD